MKTNNAAFALIREFEGLRTTAYYDTGNVLTIGYGHTSAAGAPRVMAGMKITAAEAAEILTRDVVGAESDVAEMVKVPLTENQFGALVSFVFNLGRGQVASSTLLRKLNAGDYAGAAEQFGRWIYDDGVKLDGLIRRRAAERALFEAGAATPEHEMQTILAALGLYTSKIDGKWGPRSQAALDAFNLARDRIAALSGA
ncbi:glycoside hydrolase family protein [Paracoccus aestuariivivens]|uniref:Lysozyme n=1 Tax=Paracoccus aestuariivivens TaxID=1820333 RepID=A0A6L6J8G8_9RHOB|nr:lysozyme [Paracoccus aestuariivivens]MTH76301.1 glycoside hydrolase family protein [Paracoccus aestuariivivens]